MLESVFLAGGTSYNAVITLEDFPERKPQTIHHCNYDETIGNTGAGKALTLSRLGYNVTFQTLLGNDAYAEKIRSHLQHPSIALHADIDPKGTERHTNIMNAVGERISIFTNPSTDTPKINYNAYKSAIQASKHSIINISNYCRHFLPICKATNRTIWTDLHDYDGKNSYHEDFISAADFIFLSSENLKAYKPFMTRMINEGKQLVVCTHGREGATAIDASGAFIEIPIIDTYDLINANGAGDAFFSGFFYAYTKGYALKKCMEIATICGGLTVASKTIFNPDISMSVVEQEYKKHYV